MEYPNFLFLQVVFLCKGGVGNTSNKNIKTHPHNLVFATYCFSNPTLEGGRNTQMGADM